MIDIAANILHLDLPPGRRILAISDIHANLPYFEALLQKAQFSEDDELIIVGDFLEKGADSLGTLRRIMELSRGGNVHAICGNCDDWFDIFRPEWKPVLDAHTLRYIRWRGGGLLWDMLSACGLDPMSIQRLGDYKALLLDRFQAEWAFLEALPHAIETERIVLAHAAADPSKPLREHRAGELSRFDSLLTSGRRFDKWLVVGHWPVMLYGEDKVCANPIIDREKHIICIDGGCVLKDDGQLNALIIPDKDSEDFDFIAYDPFPERRVLSSQAEGGPSYYIRWGDSQVQVLHRGEEFSRCRHVRTGYEMDILTKYLFTSEEITGCNDCTDYVLPLEAGDLVSVVEETSRGYFVKHRGVSGWYFGELA